MVVGGDFASYGTIEYTIPITADDMFRLAFFVDGGFDSRTPRRPKGTDIRVSPGMGIRISVPAMGPAPIAVDFAYPGREETRTTSGSWSTSPSAWRGKPAPWPARPALASCPICGEPSSLAFPSLPGNRVLRVKTGRRLVAVNLRPTTCRSADDSDHGACQNRPGFGQYQPLRDPTALALVTILPPSSARLSAATTLESRC